MKDKVTIKIDCGEVAPAALVRELGGELTGGNWSDNGRYHLLVAIGHNPAGEPRDVLWLASSASLEEARKEARKQARVILLAAENLGVQVPWQNISIAHGNEPPNWFEPIAEAS